MSLALLARTPDALPVGARHVHHRTVDSTNAAALSWVRGAANELSCDGADDPGKRPRRQATLPVAGAVWWVTADRQTAGRGRRGREWVSSPGNLYATAVMVDSQDAAPRAELPFAAANALLEAVERTCPAAAANLALKWPNDLLLSGRKVAGILLEAVSTPAGTAVAFGFGVNCASHPQSLAASTTSLRDEGHPVSPADLFAALVDTLWREVVFAGHPLDTSTVARWRARAHGIGRPIVVRLPNCELHGTFEDLTDDGHLILRRVDGTREHVVAGDVFFSDQRVT